MKLGSTEGPLLSTITMGKQVIRMMMKAAIFFVVVIVGDVLSCGLTLACGTCIAAMLEHLSRIAIPLAVLRVCCLLAFY